MCIRDRRYATQEFYFKSQDEMWKLFKNYPGAIENSRLISDSCNIELPLGEYLLPKFPIPEKYNSHSPDDYLKVCCEKGLKNVYSKINDEIINRLDFELDVIKKMGFAGYFLIVMDFVDYSKKNNIPVGPGRGSVAGSLVAYTLSLIHISEPTRPY